MLQMLDLGRNILYHVSLEKMKNTRLPENFLDVWAD